MIVKYSDYLWGDSLLKAINIDYENINVIIFNEIAEENILIQCSNCIEVSSIIFGEDWIIDGIVLDTVPASKYCVESSFSSMLMELHIQMISGQEYYIVCKDIVFTKTEDDG